MAKRQCGSCTACCEGWLRSKVIDMQPGKPCVHCTVQGCAIYPDPRPWQSILRTRTARREEREERALAEDLLAFFGTRLVGYRFDQPAYNLSYANRRRLEIARAMAARPRILLLDEPAAGMNPKETQEITALTSRLRDEKGFTVLVIEHDMNVVEGVSDRVVALDHGANIAEGSYEHVATHPAVVESYMGKGATVTR